MTERLQLDYLVCGKSGVQVLGPPNLTQRVRHRFSINASCLGAMSRW